MNKKTPSPVSWTIHELNAWADAGLIPCDLLQDDRSMELGAFIKKNITTLHKHYKRNDKAENYQLKLPSIDEWDSTFELQVIDKRTGKVVKILEKKTDFQLCDGLVLRINEKELNEWESETSEAKNLTKEQSEDLKSFVAKFGAEKSLTRQEIATFIEEIKKPKKRKYRQSGHLVDEKLKYTLPQTQMTLFDLLSPETKEKIEDAKIEVKAEGIKLTPPESKLIYALNLILHEKSQNTNPKASNYYAGNQPNEMVPYGGNNLQSNAAVIMFRPAELYKAYLGHDRYSSHDIQFINNLMLQLENKKVLIKYDRVKKISRNKKIETLTDRIEEFQSLIKILRFIPDLTNEEKDKLDRGDTAIHTTKGELVVALNPIFTDQIDTKFIEFPEDTNRRLVIAARGHDRVTASMITLMEWMLRSISSKRYIEEINEDKLPFLLGLEKYVREKRKKLLRERIQKDIEAITNMGIIIQTTKEPNSVGGFKWVFHLNKDYA